MNDLRQAFRILLKTPAFTLTAVLALAFGIGATTAVFSVVDRILFRSLPYFQEERLVSLGLVAPIEPQEFMLGADYVEWRRQQTPLASLTSWSGVADCDLTDGTPIRAACAQVEANFLRTLGCSGPAGPRLYYRRRPAQCPSRGSSVLRALAASVWWRLERRWADALS